MMAVSSTLPDNLMIEILARLPVRSLMQFRCVAKSWNTLIKTPSFVKKHLIQSNNRGNTNLVVTSSRMNDFDKSTFYIFEDKTLTDLVYRDFELKVNSVNYFTCNGVFCFCNGDCHVALWNPTTREFKALPSWMSNFSPYDELFQQWVGLGFDPKTNDLKVVHYVQFLDETTRHCCCDRLAIYSLKSNTWRIFDAVPRDLSRNYFNMVHINGVMYFGLRTHSVSGKIISLDMGSEMFGEIYSPDFAPRDTYEYEGLYEYDNTISWLVCEKHDQRMFHVLVFRDMSWTKQVTIGPIYGLAYSLGFWTEGEFLYEVIVEMDPPSEDLHYESTLVLYDPRTQKTRILGTWSLPILLQVFTYKESLVSFNGIFYGQEYGNVLGMVAAQDFFN